MARESSDRPGWDARACFVAGSAKSGTTLLMALLDGHPSLLPIPEETAYFPTVRRKYRKASREVQAEYLMETAESRLLFEREAIDRGNRDYRAFPREAMRSEFEKRFRDPANQHRDLLALFAETYAAVLSRPSESIAWWMEKTPANRWCIPDICRTYPESRLLLTMRDPRAVIASILQRAKKNPQREGFSMYLCVKYWVQSAKLAWEFRDADFAWVVRFERLLREPKSVLEELCAFLEVEYVPELESPTKAGNPWKGNSTEQSGGFQKIDQAPLSRWKSLLEPAELAFIEALAAPWMEKMGYPPELSVTSMRDILRKQPMETFRDYRIDRRRWIGDCLTGFWKERESD